MKKILALVLALTLALGTFSFAAAAPEDVVGTDYEDAVGKLTYLGIIAGFPDGTYRPAEPVTRAQFAEDYRTALERRSSPVRCRRDKICRCSR